MKLSTKDKTIASCGLWLGFAISAFVAGCTAFAFGKGLIVSCILFLICVACALNSKFQFEDWMGQ